MQEKQGFSLEPTSTSFLDSIFGDKQHFEISQIAEGFLDYLQGMSEKHKIQRVLSKFQESMSIDYLSMIAGYEEFVDCCDDMQVGIYPELKIEPGITFSDYLVKAKVVNKSELKRMLGKHYKVSDNATKSDPQALVKMCVGYGTLFVGDDRIYAFNNCIEYRVFNAAAKILGMPTFKNSLDFDKKYELSEECLNILKSSNIKNELDKLGSGYDSDYLSSPHFVMEMFEFIYQLCQNSASIFENEQSESFNTAYNLIALTLYPICSIFNSPAFISYTISKFGGNHLLPIINNIYRRFIIIGTLSPMFEGKGKLSTLSMYSALLIDSVVSDGEMGYFESLDRVLSNIPEIHRFGYFITHDEKPIESINSPIIKHYFKLFQELNTKNLPGIRSSAEHLPDDLKHEAISSLDNLESRFEELYKIEINDENSSHLFIKVYAILRGIKNAYKQKKKFIRISEAIVDRRELARSHFDNNKLSEAQSVIAEVDSLQKNIHEALITFTKQTFEAIDSCFEAQKNITDSDSVSSDSASATDMVEREKLEALKNANTQKVLQLETAIEKLNTDNQRLNDILSDKNELISNLEQRLQGALSKSSITISDSLKQCMYGNPSYNDVVTAIRELYPHATFADNIEKVISKCNYENPARVFKYLNLICSDYFNSIKSGKPDAVSKEILEPYYSANESNTTVQDVKLRSMREFPFNGSKVLITKHLTIGETFNPTKTVQIFFDIHFNEVRIGYIGQHLKTSS
ncbi:hypothetical protein FORC36_5457 (plasmid) [Vibrio vulnificus]|uniref:TMF family protein n=1 Tax=Vibrio vulnificus TaxID=672 RepID=UPI000A206E55|nr:TMF family protein [Vibrio vulnificus]ARN69974.1 hypothetical protein FORC36_5457 [Vibrio vulnificus]